MIVGAGKQMTVVVAVPGCILAWLLQLVFFFCCVAML